MHIPPLPKDILNRLVNLGGIEKTLKCRKCKKFKKHISVSYAEIVEDNDLIKFFGRVSDLNPAANVGVGTPFVCDTCGNVLIEQGLFSDTLNRAMQNYKEVYVDNTTSFHVSVSVYYLDEDECWQTASFSFSPGETSKVLGGNNRRTSNRYVYFYAEATDEGYVWKGNDTHQMVNGAECGFIKHDIGKKSKFTWTMTAN